MLIGHQKQWQFLRASVKMGKISHAYLFSGQEKLGKKRVGLDFAELIFRQDLNRSTNPPGSARASLFNPPHPDFIFLQPEKRVIQIDQIRELIWKISLKPIFGSFKIALIDQAHLMTKESQNCFLKTLEEPKGRAILILITSSPDFLLPTILSRCEIIKFYPVKRIEIEQFLEMQRVPEQRRGEILQISLGRPGMAIDLVSSPQKLEHQRNTIKELIKILNSDLFFRFQYLKELSKKSSNWAEVLAAWLNFFHFELLEKLQSDFKGLTNFSVSKLKTILEEIQKTIFLISTTNINQKLALEILMLRF